MSAALSTIVLSLLCWAALWTFANPAVQVPEPESVTFAPPRDRSGDRGGDHDHDRGSGRGQVLFLGDFAPADAALPLVQKHGYGFQFSHTLNLLSGYDAVVANLESPITESDRPWPLPKKWVYRAHPDLVTQMKRAGIDVVTLANNHVYDYGRQGLADTIRHLDRGGVKHLGAGLSEALARRGLVLQTAGARIGLLAYLQDKIGWRLWVHAFALDTPFKIFAGAARPHPDDLSQDISRLRAVSDLVVVTVHWGENYRPVNEDQRALARAFIDAGADAVIGHHAHQYQPAALLEGRPVVYGLGNYAFGTIGNSSMRFGMGTALHLASGRLTAMEFIPLLTQNRIVNFRPRIPRGKRLNRFFKDFTERSAALGAVIERRGNRGWLWLDDNPLSPLPSPPSP